MSFMEIMLILVSSGFGVYLVRILSLWLKERAVVRNLEMASAIDWAAEFAVFAMEHYADKHGLKGEDKYRGAIEMARERLNKVGLPCDEDELGRALGAAFMRVRGDLK